MNGGSLITLLTFTPLVGGVMVAWLGRRSGKNAGQVALAFSLSALLQALHLALRFNGGSAGFQFQEEHRWIPSLQIHYVVGMDGLSLLMVVLSALLVPMAQVVSRRVAERAALFHALLLFLQSGLFGTFTALNFFHWFIFWELSLIPTYFLIKLWGGPGRTKAATQFLLYTMAGSVTLLLAFQVVYLATDTFDFPLLAQMGRRGELAAELGRLRLGPVTGPALAMLVFLGVLLGFAVKVPMMPFHTWLPAAYAEAPAGVTMILTGAMSKMGLYGFLRILLPMFPAQMRAALTPLLWLAVATAVLSALAAFAQKDLKRMLAYSSVNHLAYCLLAIFAAAQVTGPEARWTLERSAALNGVVLHMFNHGLIAATLFCFVGFLEERNEGRRGLDDFGGLRRRAPVFAGLMGIAFFASLGLPGLNGFVGEFLIFKGAFALAPWAAALSALGLLATAVFLLTLMQRVFHGPQRERWQGFGDLTMRERLLVGPAIGLMFLVGIWPQSVIGLVNVTMMNLATGLPR
jgi:NADH-quinone oxidoreductase subunit M